MKREEFEKRFVSARRAAISSEFGQLNDKQLEAVLVTQGPMLLLAGAGSGKTTVLINRIANLLKYGSGSDSELVPPDANEKDLNSLEEYAAAAKSAEGRSSFLEGQTEEYIAHLTDLCAVSPVEPWRVIAITFTNKAAGEMKQRLARMFGPASEDIWAMTFHSACSRILRRDIDKLGYDRSFTIYDATDTASLMKRIQKDFDVDDKNLPHKTVLGYISRAKDAMMFSEDFLSDAQKGSDERRRLIARLYVEYERRLKSCNALDFDDLILLTIRLFQENPDILLYYQRRFSHVLVDEYQDTNNLQYLLVAALAGGHGNVCVVGDDDQSIYKFRGATIENIMNFETQFKDALVIRLEENYRSTSYILDAANEVIQNNKGRKGKKLWTQNDPGLKPELHLVDSERTEAQFVADAIMTSSIKGCCWREHAVLYRMNAQSNQLESAFKRAGIPYRIVGGTGFYERSEIKDMLAYLCVIHNPNDDERLLRIINDPPRGIGNTTVQRLAEFAGETSQPIFTAIREAQNRENLKSAAARLHQFADMIDSLRELSSTAALDDLYDALVNRTGYIRMLEEKETHENISRLENVRELKTNILSFMKEHEGGGTLFDFLSETALYTDLDREDLGTDRVNMMTMHSAKGLEFDTVFIVGAEEGIFPGFRTIGNPLEIEEERRLCYVAMTRAMRRLYFVSAHERMLFGKTTSNEASRFVREISDDNLDIHDQTMKFDLGYSHSDPQDFPSGSTRDYATPAMRSAKYSKHPARHYSFRTPVSKPTAAAPNYKKGDVITHKAFGRGLISNISPAGGDALLEIIFDEKGTKRLLLNTASEFMSMAD